MAQSLIPVASPYLSNREKKYLLEAYESGYISSKGGFIERFEDEFASFHDTKRAVSCSNGTSALHLALASLGIGRDCEVIVPNLTFVATYNAVLYQKAVPIVVEVDQKNLCIDPDRLQKAISKRTKAIICVHLYGTPCQMDKLIEICVKHKIHLIEDCAQAFGTKFADKYVGTFGTIGCFSFYGNKTITTGQGGMIITQSDVLADKIRHLENQSMRYPYSHTGLGYNYRMTNLEAAIGLAQIERANDIFSSKRRITNFYHKNLENMFTPNNKDIVSWMNVIRCNDINERNGLMNKLRCDGIETRPCFEPLNPYFLSQKELSEKLVCLPSGPKLSDKELTRIAEEIHEYYRTY